MTPQQAVRALHAETAAALRGLAERVAEGSLSARAFGDRAAAILEEAHAEAVYWGRRHGGDDAPLDDEDRRYGEQVVDAESEFLAGFVRDLEGGEMSAAQAGARAELYAGKLAATATEVWTLTDDAATYVWRLGTELNCSDCPPMAHGGPYTLETLRGRYPRSGWSQCKTNCKCSLTRSDGQEGFSLA